MIEQDHQLARIQAIFGLPEEVPLPRVDRTTLQTYRQHLKSHLRVPFDALHAETRPPVRRLVHSVRVLRILDVEDRIGHGVLCEVQNHRGTHTLPLAEVGVREENPNYQIVDDYAYWFINCR